MTPAELLEFYCLVFIDQGEVLPDGCDLAAIVDRGHASADDAAAVLTPAGQSRLAELHAVLAHR